MQRIFPLLFLILLFNKTYSQCADSSDATIDETINWITQKFNKHGERYLPPSIYKVRFEGTIMHISEIGMDVNFELKDTTSKFSIDLKNIDFNKTEVKDITKKGKRFEIVFYGENGKMSYWSQALGNLENIGFTMYFSPGEEQNLDVRIIKALKHAKCILGGNSKKQTEKF
jgi:hypothetical protein